MNTQTLRHALPDIIALARRSGMLAMEHWGNISADIKDGGSYVTDIDRRVERMIREELTRLFPAIDILGEEYDEPISDNADYVWVIDPIDGTANFVGGLPSWGVSIGLLHNGVPIFGVLFFPASDETFYAIHNDGAFYIHGAARKHLTPHLRTTAHAGIPLHVRHKKGINRDDIMLISSYVPEIFDLHFPGKLRMPGSAIGLFAYLAKGQPVMSIVHRVRIWDVVAGIIIAREAGALLLDLNTGEPLQPFSNTILTTKTVNGLIIITPTVAETWKDYIQRKTD